MHGCLSFVASRNETLSFILLDSRSGRRWLLGTRALTLGSASSCDVRLLGEGVALRHALIEQRRPGVLSILDYGAAAGTLLNGEKIRHHTLSAGDVITIAESNLLVTLGSVVALSVAERMAAGSAVVPALNADTCSDNDRMTSRPFMSVGHGGSGHGASGHSASGHSASGHSAPIAAVAAAPEQPEEESPPSDGAPCVMVRVYWGEQLLRSAQVSRKERYVIGEDATADMPLSADLLGVQRLLLVNRRGEVSLVQAGEVSVPRRLQPCEQVSMRCGDLTITARCVLAPRPIRPSRWRLLSRGPLPLMLGALLTVAALPQALAQWPRLPQAEEPSLSQYAFMRARLPEAEKEPPPPEPSDPPPRLAARGEQGRANAKSRQLESPEPNVEPNEMPPRHAILPHATESNEDWTLKEASQFGLIALLGQAGDTGQSDVSPWERLKPEISGIDWGLVGPRYNPGGLQLSGIGSGGGGVGEGIALGQIHTITPSRRGWWGPYHCCRRRPRQWQVPVMRMSRVHVRGPVSDEAVSRIVRASSAAYDVCHKREFNLHPAFRGITKVRFVLTPRGRVFSVALQRPAASESFDLCVRTTTLALRFPRGDALAASYHPARSHDVVAGGEIATVSFDLSFRMSLVSQALSAGF